MTTWQCFVVIGLARAADLFSTWLYCPTLRLERNPVMRWLGWRRAMVLNLAFCVAMATMLRPALWLVFWLSVAVTGWNLWLWVKWGRQR